MVSMVHAKFRSVGTAIVRKGVEEFAKMKPSEFSALCRLHTPQALRTIIHIMRHGKNELKLRAAAEILNRGWGTPRQTVDVGTGDDQQPLVATIVFAPLGKLDGVMGTLKQHVEPVLIEEVTVGTPVSTSTNDHETPGQ